MAIALVHFTSISLVMNQNFFIIYRVSPIKANRDNMIASLLQQTSLKGLPPQWIRPPPPRLEILEGEVRLHVRVVYSYATFISEHVYAFIYACTVTVAEPRQQP